MIFHLLEFRHRAALGITEKTDSLAVVVSEETGQISYINNGEFVIYENTQELIEKLELVGIKNLFLKLIS